MVFARGDIHYRLGSGEQFVVERYPRMPALEVEFKLDRKESGFQNSGYHARQHLVPGIPRLAAHDGKNGLALF
jgi:hypothetical protein